MSQLRPPESNEGLHALDMVYLAALLQLLAMVLFVLATDIRHWQILSALNLSAPIVQVRAVVDAVRARRLLVVKWTVLSACLLWLPLIAVLLKAAFAVDLLRGLHISVVVVNVLLGVLLIPLGLRSLASLPSDLPMRRRFSALSKTRPAPALARHVQVSRHKQISNLA